MRTVHIPRSLTVRPRTGTSLLLGVVLVCALLGLAPIAARAAVASSSVPGAGSGSGGTGRGRLLRRQHPRSGRQQGRRARGARWR